MKNVETLLRRAWVAYAAGNPFMSDAEFDALASSYGFDEFEEGDVAKKVKHAHRMYSLKKVFDEEPSPITGEQVESPKLDGAAINLYYDDRGTLVQAATRGDGIEGEDITDKVYLLNSVLKKVPFTLEYGIQISGEICAPETVKNSRNYASGALHLKSAEEFKEREKNLTFVAYSVQPPLSETYSRDIELLKNRGFHTILDDGLDIFPQDGTVYRLDNNADYYNAGYTAKHPRGAYARKQSSDVAVEETVLTEVIWDTGRSGKITPVAHFEPVVIDDATISKATLNNVGFIEEMELEIGDTILVTRSGGIIPKVLGKL